jgi:hypothetical protein
MFLFSYQNITLASRESVVLVCKTVGNLALRILPGNARRSLSGAHIVM